MKNHYRTRDSVRTLGTFAVLILLLSSAPAAVAQVPAADPLPTSNSESALAPAAVREPTPIGGSVTDPAAIRLPSGEVVPKPVDGGASMGAPTRAAESKQTSAAPEAPSRMARSPRLQQMAAPTASKPAGTEGMPGGVDVANWQGNVNWQNVWNQGARFAYVKASEGPWSMNEYFAQQYNGSAGVGMIRGAYHFARPNLSSGASQARTFVQNGGGWSADGRTLPGVLDLETNNSDRSGACFGMSAAQLTGWTADFVNTYKSLTSRDAVIYTGYYFWRDCVGNSSAFSQSNPLWVPSYGISMNRVLIPGSWPRFTFWQFSDTGPYNGGDSNVFNGNSAGLAAFARGVPVSPGSQAISQMYETNKTRLGATASSIICGIENSGCYQNFQNGAIVWSPTTGAQVSPNGAIRSRWSQLNFENSILGYPTTGQICGTKNNGCYQNFQNGAIVWSPTTGAWATWGGIRTAWQNNNFENGPLGYPTGPETPTTGGGSYQNFQNGAITLSPSGIAQIVMK